MVESYRNPSSIAQLNLMQFQERLHALEANPKKADPEELLIYRTVKSLMQRSGYLYEQLQVLDGESLTILSHAEFHLSGVIGVMQNDITQGARDLFTKKHADTIQAIRQGAHEAQ